jgi:hypothetical protein
MKQIVYVAGPYSSDDPQIVDENIGRAREVAITLVDMGYGVIVPHLNTFKFEDRCQYVEYEDFQQMYMKLMMNAGDVVLFLPGWEHSKGCRMERLVAESMGIPCFTAVMDMAMNVPPGPVPDGLDGPKRSTQEIIDEDTDREA